MEYDVSATDEDMPVDTLTYSFQGSVAAGATLNSTNGHFSWTPSTANGTNFFTIRVTDSGSPALYDELTLAVVVSAANGAPSLSLGTARVTEAFAHFETFANNTGSGLVMFRQPNFSSTTTNYLGTQTNYTRVTNEIPGGNPNAGARALAVSWNLEPARVIIGCSLAPAAPRIFQTQRLI